MIWLSQVPDTLLELWETRFKLSRAEISAALTLTDEFSRYQLLEMEAIVKVDVFLIAPPQFSADVQRRRKRVFMTGDTAYG